MNNHFGREKIRAHCPASRRVNRCLIIICLGCGSGDSQTIEPAGRDEKNPQVAEKSEFEREEEAIEWVKQMAGTTFYDYEMDAEFRQIRDAKPPSPDHSPEVILVRLGGPEVTDIMRLSALTRLKVLSLGSTSVVDVSPLADSPDLELLYLSYNPVTDLSPLSKLQNLRVLWLDNSKVTELSPLENLTSLEVLRLSETPVVDLRPLSGPGYGTSVLKRVTWKTSSSVHEEHGGQK